MNRRDRLGRVLTQLKDKARLVDHEVHDDLRFVLEELARLDTLRDEVRDLRTRVELVQYQLRSMRETVNGI